VSALLYVTFQLKASDLMHLKTKKRTLIFSSRVAELFSFGNYHRRIELLDFFGTAWYDQPVIVVMIGGLQALDVRPECFRIEVIELVSPGNGRLHFNGAENALQFSPGNILAPNNHEWNNFAVILGAFQNNRNNLVEPFEKAPTMPIISATSPIAVTLSIASSSFIP